MSAKKSGNADLGRHLKLLRIKCNLTMMKTAEVTGITQGYISQIENGIYTPSAKTLSKLARAYEVAELSLLRKAGIVQLSNTTPATKDFENSFKSNLFGSDPIEQLDEARELMQLLKRGLHSLEHLTSQMRQNSLVTDMASAPVLEDKPAETEPSSMHLPIFDASWQPILNAGGVPGVFSLPSVLCNSDKDAFILTIADNSMSPSINAGDWVVISPASPLSSGNIVAINDRNLIQARSYAKVDDTVIFNPLNPEFSHKLLMSRGDDPAVEIVGRILRVINREF